MQILVHKNGNQLGPFTMDQLRQGLSDGSFAASDLAWHEGLPSWVSLASLVPGIAPVPVAAAYNGYAPVQAAAYAGFWRRVLALIIDYCIIMFVVFVIAFIIGFAAAFSGAITSSEQAETYGQWFGIICFWLYYALMESSKMQATLGKRALGIKVYTEEGQRLSFGRATARHFGKILSGLILGIGFIMAAFTEKKQALHDIMAKTVLVKV
jgi:uncharacterized RDD family membrane protein YckC